MPSRKHQVGVIGSGPTSELHLAVLSRLDRAQPAAVFAPGGANSDALSRRYGCRIDSYGTLKEMLADTSIDVVSICAPPEERAALALEAAKAGKHLILVPPIAATTADCDNLSEAVAAAGVKVGVCFDFRFAEQVLTVKAMLGRGLLGRVHYAEADYYRGWADLAAEGASGKSGPVDSEALRATECVALDTLLFLMGGDVRTVSSYTTRSSNPELASVPGGTTSVTIVRYADARLGKVTSTVDCLQPPYFRLHLIGSEGTLLDNKFYTRALGGLRRDQWSELAVKPMAGDASVMARHEAMFRAFFHALDRAQQPPAIGLSEALITHRVLFAAEQSAERHAHKSRSPAKETE